MNQITVSTDGLESLIASFAAMPGQIARAERRAINKTVHWVQRQSLREMASGLGLAQKMLSDRVRKRNAGVNGLAAGLVWFGLNPLAATRRRFGRLVQTAEGVRARGVSFQGAFVATMPSGHEGAFERHGAKRVMRAGRYAGHLRQPIRHASLAMDTTAHRALIAAWASRAGERLQYVLGQELHYEVNVRGRA